MVSLENVLSILQSACSSNPHEVKLAEQMVGEGELKQGFFPLVAEITLTPGAPLNVQWMGAICLKNGCTKFWRKTAPNSLCAEDKAVIRKLLLSAHLVQNLQVFDQLNEVVGKVVRWDFPNHWPDLMPTLLQSLEGEPVEVCQRAVSLIYQVIKTISKKRLTADRKVFRETTQLIFPTISKHWETYLQTFNATPSLLNLRSCLLSLKLLHPMLVFGFDDIASPAPHSCLTVLINLARSHLTHRASLPTGEITAMYDKYLRNVLKILVNIQEKFPQEFAEFMTPALEFCHQIAFSTGATYDVKLVSKALCLLSCVMVCEDYDVFKLVNRNVNMTPKSVQFNEARNSFFTEVRLKEMCSTCIQKYLKLSNIELENWTDNPEEFAFEETRYIPLFHLKASAEAFVLNMTATYQDIVCPYIVELIKSCSTLDINNLDQVLLIDSVYSVVIVCSYDLFDYIDIDEWYGTLAQEIKRECQWSAILRRRTLELIGRWVTIKLSQDKHPAVYELCLNHLQQGQDLVVRLTAATALQAAVSDFAFYPAAFSPYLATACSELYTLLNELSDPEAQVKVLQVYKDIIEGCGKYISAFVSPLIQCLPSLWHSAGEHRMLQSQLIITCCKLAKCLRAESVQLYAFSQPVLNYAFTQDPELVLLEDGLALWMTLLENAPSPAPLFSALFHHLSPLLQLGSESLKTSLQIIECSIVLDPDTVVSSYGCDIVSACHTLHQDLTGEGRVHLNNIVLTIIKCVNRQHWPDLTPLLQAFVNNLTSNEDFVKVLTVNLNIVCYVILLDLQYFSQLTRTINIETLFEVWFAKIDTFYRTTQYKLSLIALLTLAPHHPPLLHNYFNKLFNVILVCLDKCTVKQDGKMVDCILIKEEDCIDGESEDYKRRSALQKKDILSEVDIIAFVRSSLVTLEQNLGQSFATLSQDLEPGLVEKISAYLN